MLVPIIWGAARSKAEKKQPALVPLKFPFPFFSLLSFSIVKYAQNARLITGTVTDTTGKPLQGVTIATDKSKKNVISKEDGSYSIQGVMLIKKLSFSYVGMKVITQPLNSTSS